MSKGIDCGAAAVCARGGPKTRFFWNDPSVAVLFTGGWIVVPYYPPNRLSIPRRQMLLLVVFVVGLLLGCCWCCCGGYCGDEFCDFLCHEPAGHLVGRSWMK